MKDDVIDIRVVDSGSRFGNARFPTAALMPVRTDVTSGGTVDLGESAAWVVEAAKKLESRARLNEGWDSYGGRSLKLEARMKTVHVLGLLKSNDLPVPAVILGSDGNIHLEWRNKGKELGIEMGDSGKIHYLLVFPNGDVQEGTAQSDHDSSLRGLVRWLTHA